MILTILKETGNHLAISSTVEIYNSELPTNETEKAVQFEITFANTKNGMGTSSKIWFPKSVISVNENGSLVVPQWVVSKNISKSFSYNN